MTKEDNLNKLQERLLLKEQNNQGLQRENRLLEEAQKVINLQCLFKH